ncbi:unnamed protein product [Rotaria sp. Silwood2]|nr:unnamed protein product [Rotaria sp. Silwood2]CAF4463686.1 unnamed protein product [Rotaria sp. Silwood2]CAF4560052.1 unnamed protein product [Rotaria sp. Silwood2]
MMKIFFIFFAAVFLPICTSRCQFGCTCYDDSICEYYCYNYQCHQEIPLWQKCSGYYIHPRECGSVSYCDPNSNYTCQIQKSNGERCQYSYSCLSDYCDYNTKRCQFKNTATNWLLPVVMPSVIVFTLLMIFFILIVVRIQRRRAALAYYQCPYVVLPPNTSYSYQNSSVVTESSPPPYPGAISPPLPKTYQN